MSFVIVDDNGTVQIRASIRTVAEMNILIAKLTSRLEQLPKEPTNERHADLPAAADVRGDDEPRPAA